MRNIVRKNCVGSTIWLAGCGLSDPVEMRSFGTVVFSHGKESGPWGVKITAMADTARRLGVAVESVDYRGMDDPGARVDKLIATAAAIAGSVVLVGSSLGGHVSATAAARIKPRGLFLLAPAFYMPGFEAYTPQDVTCPTAIVHGWRDDIVPVDNSVRWAREHLAALHVLDSDHRLEDQVDTICLLLADFLTATCEVKTLHGNERSSCRDVSNWLSTRPLADR